MKTKSADKKLNIIQRTDILLKLVHQEEEPGQIFARLNAHQLQELRNFLENQILHFSKLKDDTPLSLSGIKEKLEPIPNYYYKQDCREPIDACYNETCITSYPQCFSKKMKLQLKVILELFSKYTEPQTASN